MKAAAVLALALAAGCGGGSGPAVSGSDLAEMVKVANHSPAALITCNDTPHADKGVITDCRDGLTTYRVTWDDSQGHFTVVDTTFGVPQ